MNKKIDCSLETRARLLGLTHLLGYDHCQMGYYLLDKKLIPEAQSEFLKVVELNPDMIQAWEGLAHIADLNHDTPAKEYYLSKITRLKKG